ncbi:sulfite exporter TauE/SafE family protein [Amycolatopsis jejuensis]|uniref:sulfite exporter TauE/SafE family protein n=1 Tax=Amycolatopsis jejuensis TaxID=330084 RepID=UPI00068A1F6F|nr:sulfite exporter TauE/SafE family protein [Amycolatopsis jejuensis]
MSTALILLVVLAAAAAQRVTGMGFALISAPLLVLLLGGFTGVLVVNVCAAFTSAVILTRLWRDIQWRRWRMLAGGATLGVVPGVWIVRIVPPGWLELTVGILVALGLFAAKLVRTPRTGAGRLAVVASGAVSGLMNTSAGVGGPALTVYAVATAWDQRSFVATVQPYFLTVGAMSVAALLITHRPAEGLAPGLWAAIFGACAAGLVIGEWLSGRVSELASYRMLLALALLGAAAAATRGGLSIAGG